MLIFTTNFVCSHLDGVLNDCVRLDVSHSLLAWRVGVGGMELLVRSVGGGVRERGRIFSSAAFFGFCSGLVQRLLREQQKRRSACCRRALKRAARALRDLCGKKQPS